MARFRKKAHKRKNTIKYTSGKKVKKFSKSLLNFKNGLFVLNHLSEIDCFQLAIKLHRNISHLLPDDFLDQVFILNINRSEMELKFKILEIECEIQFINFRNHEGVVDIFLLHFLENNIAISLPEDRDGIVIFRNCNFRDSIWENVFQEQIGENNYTLLQIKCCCSQIFSELTKLLFEDLLEN